MLPDNNMANFIELETPVLILVVMEDAPRQSYIVLPPNTDVS